MTNCTATKMGQMLIFIMRSVPRRLFFAALQRIAFHNEKESRRTWPRCHVSLEKSSEIYKPLKKMSQTKPHPSVPPHPPSQIASIFHGFSTWWSQICRIHPPFWPAVQDGKNQGRGRDDLGVWYSSLTGLWFAPKFKLKMVSNVLLLSYLDKIGLSLTGEAGQASAYL